MQLDLKAPEVGPVILAQQAQLAWHKVLGQQFPQAYALHLDVIIQYHCLCKHSTVSGLREPTCLQVVGHYLPLPVDCKVCSGWHANSEPGVHSWCQSPPKHSVHCDHERECLSQLYR